jgi:hypothetical protein
VRQCTQLNEIRFHTTSLNANCEHMLTTHVTHLVVLDSTNFDTFCFFHRAAALDAVRVLELAYGTLGNDVSAHVKWFANSASLLHVTLRELHLVPPTLLSALVSNTTLTSLYLFGLSSLNDDALRLVLDHRPRQHRRWQLRELQLRNNYALSPSALFALATSLRDLRLDSFAVEILTEPLDRPHHAPPRRHCLAPAGAPLPLSQQAGYGATRTHRGAPCRR